MQLKKVAFSSICSSGAADVASDAEVAKVVEVAKVAKPEVAKVANEAAFTHMTEAASGTAALEAGMTAAKAATSA
jgi:hypothetical protein